MLETEMGRSLAAMSVGASYLGIAVSKVARRCVSALPFTIPHKNYCNIGPNTSESNKILITESSNPNAPTAAD